MSVGARLYLISPDLSPRSGIEFDHNHINKPSIERPAEAPLRMPDYEDRCVPVRHDSSP